jgi:phenylacetic acid degradation operon negative regulatory protein
VVPTAKSLLLDLLSAAGHSGAPVKRLLVACQLFDISENSVRVTLVRLSAAGLIEATGRGEYRLGAAAGGLAREVAAWPSAEQRVRPWSGGWLAVHTAGMARGERSVLRRRSRALRIVGLRELERGLFVRPDNLEGGVDGARLRLHSLGLEEQATVFIATSFDSRAEARARGLWDGRALGVSYRRSKARLEKWLERAHRLELDVAAREAFLLGGSAIRAIVYDPLLPVPLVDVEERRRFVETVRRFDRAGRAIWKAFGFRLGPAAPSTVRQEDEIPLAAE